MQDWEFFCSIFLHVDDFVDLAKARIKVFEEQNKAAFEFM